MLFFLYELESLNDFLQILFFSYNGRINIKTFVRRAAKKIRYGSDFGNLDRIFLYRNRTNEEEKSTMIELSRRGLNIETCAFRRFSRSCEKYLWPLLAHT